MEFEFFAYFIFFIAAFLGGFIDAIAGGGGLITLPALMAMGVPPHMALATNKLQGSFGSFTATLNFAKKGLIDFNEIFLGIVFTFLGASLGTYLILLLNPEFLKIVIPFLLIFIFVYTLFSPKIGENERESKLKPNVFYLLFGLLLGFYDGFFGPGAGSFWTFAFVALMGINMKKAVANTKALNFTSNIVSLGVFVVGGQILWLVGILMATGQIVGAWVGSNLVVKKDIKFIRTMFLFVVGATIVKLILDYF